MQIDDDILQCRDDLMQAMKKSSGKSEKGQTKIRTKADARKKLITVTSSEAVKKTSSKATAATAEVKKAAPEAKKAVAEVKKASPKKEVVKKATKKTTSKKVTTKSKKPALILSFEDLTAKESKVVDASWEPTEVESKTPAREALLKDGPKDEWAVIGDEEMQALTQSVDADPSEKLLIPDAFDKSSDDDHAETLAMIGSAVKKAEQEHAEEELAAKAETEKSDDDNIEIDELDIEIADDDGQNTGLDLELAELEEQLREIGLDDEDDDQETEDAISEIEDAAESSLPEEPVALTVEEHETLAADLDDVGKLLDQDDEKPEQDKSIPQFDLADQILAEQRKSVASQRKGPAARKTRTKVAPVEGTVGKVINENKSDNMKAASVEVPPLSEPDVSEDTAIEQEPVAAEPVSMEIERDEVSVTRNRQSSPAVMNIVCGDDHLSSFQRQIVSDIITRDISLHYPKAESQTVMSSYMNN